MRPFRVLTTMALGLLAPACSSSTSQVCQGCGSQPWLVEDFSEYSSTSQFLSDPRGIYELGSDQNTGQMTLDKSVGYGTLTQSLRYDVPDRTGDTSSRCGDLTIRRDLTLPSQVTEVWVELEVKFVSNWSDIAPSSWSCSSAPDYKFFFGGVVNVTGRFEEHLGARGAGDFGFGAPDPSGYENFDQAHGGLNGSHTTAASIFDGQWHQHRLHFRLDSPTSASVQFWLDGVKRFDVTGLKVTNTGTPLLYKVVLGANLNQGPDQAQSYWWGKVNVWNTNPGW